MPGRTIRIARVAGIPVGISPLWLVIVALITWSLGAGYYPGLVPGISPVAAYGLGLLSALLLFASILAHEFGHALVARRRGLEIEEIDLWLLGGVARISGHPSCAGDELRFALAGPAVTAAVAALFGVVAVALPGSTPAAVRAVIGYQLVVNLLILAFNLVPAFPLDGGRIVRALLWRHGGDIVKATDTAAALGLAFGYLLTGGGVAIALFGFPGGVWFAVIGLFLIIAANAERAQERVIGSFTGVSAAELMSHPAVSIAGELSLGQATRYFERYLYTAFPVTDPAGHVVGILSVDRRRRAPSSTDTVAEAADRDPDLLIDQDLDVGELLERAAFARVGRAAVLDHDRRPLGVVSVTDIYRTIRARNDSAHRPRATRSA